MFALCEYADPSEGYGVLVDSEGDSDGNAPAPGVYAGWDERLRGVPCRQCNGLEGEASMVVCDRCKGCWHPSCGEGNGRNPIHAGPWYCGACRGHIVLHGFLDVTEDLGLIDYLWRG